MFKFQIVSAISWLFFQMYLIPDPVKVYALQLVDMSFKIFNPSLSLHSLFSFFLTILSSFPFSLKIYLLKKPGY